MELIEIEGAAGLSTDHSYYGGEQVDETLHDDAVKVKPAKREAATNKTCR